MENLEHSSSLPALIFQIPQPPDESQVRSRAPSADQTVKFTAAARENEEGWVRGQTNLKLRRGQKLRL
jgi:hypothetical protein